MFVVLMIIYVTSTMVFSLYQAKKLDTGTIEDWFIAGRKITFIEKGQTLKAPLLVFLDAGSAVL